MYVCALCTYATCIFYAIAYSDLLQVCYNQQGHSLVGMINRLIYIGGLIKFTVEKNAVNHFLVAS